MRWISRIAFLSAVGLVGCGGERLRVGSGDAGGNTATIDASAPSDTGDASDASLDGTHPSEPGTTCDVLEAQSLRVRQQSCTQCHGVPPGVAGFDWVMD